LSLQPEFGLCNIALTEEPEFALDSVVTVCKTGNEKCHFY